MILQHNKGNLIMLVQSKSNLARLMAAENLLVEQKNVGTASFDLKSRILTVPILDGNLSDYLYDLLLGHEVGHALETPGIGWHDSIIDLKVDKSILNVCEDVRIEKKIKRKFPGIRISFLKGYEELLEKDFFKTKGKDLNTHNLIDRINLYCKIGPAHGIEFSDEESVLLDEVTNTETFEEVVVVARKLQEFMKNEIKQNQQKEERAKKLVIEITDDNEGEVGEPIDVDEFDEVEIVDKRTKPSNAEGKETPMNVESLTDKAFRQSESKLYEKTTKDIIYTNIPEVNLEQIVIDHDELYERLQSYNTNKVKYNMSVMKRNYNKFRLESNKVVSYLVKEFEMRKNAQQSHKGSVSKTGELDMSKLQDYKFSEDMFLRIMKVPNGKSHGLVMFIDWSGSMCHHINATIKQLLNLVMFCKKVSLPYEVYAISSHNKSIFEGSFVPKQLQDKKVGDAILGQLSLLNILSSRMNSMQYSVAASFLLDYGTSPQRTASHYVIPDFFDLSGTPLNECIVSAFELVPQFQKRNKLEIVNAIFLTDGDSQSMSRRYDYMDMHNRYAESTATPNKKTRCFFRDTVTKATAEVTGHYNILSASQTKGLLKLLKQRLQCNLIGFFICGARDVRDVIDKYDENKAPLFVDMKFEEFRKSNYTHLSNVGYDEYYILKSSSLELIDDEFKTSVTGHTTKSLVTAFSKYTGNKVNNRVVLNRFIKLIA